MRRPQRQEYGRAAVTSISGALTIGTELPTNASEDNN